jgi:neutral ceramidase
VCPGPGAQGFYQGDAHTGSPTTRWSALAFLINSVAKAKVSQEQQQCHGAKPVLLNAGEAVLPYAWVPKVTEVALLRLGNFVSTQQTRDS